MDRAQFRIIFHLVFQTDDDFLIDRSFFYLPLASSAHVTLETGHMDSDDVVVFAWRSRRDYDELDKDSKIKWNDVNVLLSKCFAMEYVADW